MKTQDLFLSIKALPSVCKISNFYPNQDIIFDFIFYVCPRFTGNGLKLNLQQTGFTASYRDGISEESRQRFIRVSNFITEAEAIGLRFSIKTIFAAADSFLLFPIPAQPPDLPSAEFIPDGFQMISNLDIYQTYLSEFGKLYRDAVYKNVPKWALQMEQQRLDKILPPETPENIKQDFIARCFSGFALDGLILRKGLFGQNPIILGVESLGVSVFQNAALARAEWLPVIDLR